MNELEIKCMSAQYVDWHELEDLQGNLKRTDANKIEKLANNLMKYGLVNPLQIWRGPAGIAYCFDAHHRKKAFAVLESRGVVIPKIPVSLCIAGSEKEAKRLLLAKESKYSWVDLSQIENYLEDIDLDLDLAIADFEIEGLINLKDSETEFFDDEMGDGEITDKDAMVKVGAFVSTEIKKSVIQDLRALESKYGSDRFKML